ncbi:MAG: hypothetical protein AAFR87_25220 [Bacteroidota bacterium]
MKNILIILVLAITFNLTYAQNKVGWFINPEIGTIFHDDHIGRTVGASIGLKLFNDHLKVGIFNMGRSGPINPEIFTVETSGAQLYRGSTQLNIRADQQAFGLLLAPSFTLNKVRLELPVNIGQMGAGFYLVGDDRNTPDGRRVSEWENQLMDERDADGGGWLEFGLKAYFPINDKGMSLGTAFYYTRVSNWETYYDPTGDFYNNNFRFALSLNFESR